MDEEQLIKKLEHIEALFAGAGTEGERLAAASVLERIRRRLEEEKQINPPVEHKFRLTDMCSRRLLVALMRRYGIRPYRYSGQRHTTVMAEVSRQFVDETLWPEFVEVNTVLHAFLDEITDRVIRQGIFADSSEAEIRKGLPAREGPGKR